MLTIDGSEGEGGGQVLRTALGLSLVTQTGFRIFNIRGNRAKPGLMRQHLTAVRAARDIGGAQVLGDEMGSKELTFIPNGVRGGFHEFSIGSAGSTSLVFQTILPALMRANEPSRIVIEGGTHNDLAPCYDYLHFVFVPALKRLGARIELTLTNYGFMPAGGGCIEVHITPAPLARLELLHRGALKQISAHAVVCGVPLKVAQRELAVIESIHPMEKESLRAETVTAGGPGNAATILCEFENTSELVVAYGSKGVTAEQVGRRVSGLATKYLNGSVPVGEHLADQLIVPLALFHGGVFKTVKPSLHTLTQLQLVPRFLPVKMNVSQVASEEYLIQIDT